MANPNILNATSIVGKSKALSLSTTAQTLLTAGSGELIKIKSLIVANTSGTSNAAFNIRYRDQSVPSVYWLAKEISLPFDSTVMFIGADFPLYLEETDYIEAFQTSSVGVDVTVSYEILT